MYKFNSTILDFPKTFMHTVDKGGCSVDLQIPSPGGAPNRARVRDRARKTVCISLHWEFPLLAPGQGAWAGLGQREE